MKADILWIAPSASGSRMTIELVDSNRGLNSHVPLTTPNPRIAGPPLGPSERRSLGPGKLTLKVD